MVKLTKNIVLYTIFSSSKIRQPKRIDLRSITVENAGVISDHAQDVKFVDNMILKFVHEIFTKYMIHFCKYVYRISRGRCIEI